MIKNVVIIDDNNFKSQTIQEYLADLLDEPVFYTRNCIAGGLFVLKDKRTDIQENPEEWLIVTDMQMPFRNDDPQIERYGGLTVIHEIARLKLNCPVIITSSEQIDEKVDAEARSSSAYYLGFIKENPIVYNKHKYETLLENLI